MVKYYTEEDVMELAERLKKDQIEIKRDLDREIISRDFYEGVIASIHVILEDLQEIFEIDLEDYYIKY